MVVIIVFKFHNVSFPISLLQYRTVVVHGIIKRELPIKEYLPVKLNQKDLFLMVE